MDNYTSAATVYNNVLDQSARWILDNRENNRLLKEGEKGRADSAVHTVKEETLNKREELTGSHIFEITEDSGTVIKKLNIIMIITGREEMWNGRVSFCMMSGVERGAYVRGCESCSYSTRPRITVSAATDRTSIR